MVIVLNKNSTALSLKLNSRIDGEISMSLAYIILPFMNYQSTTRC